MADRWNQGKPSLGDNFHPGFISPWNSGVRSFGDNEDIATIPSASIPDSFAGQMDGDSQITFTEERGRGRRKR